MPSIQLSRVYRALVFRSLFGINISSNSDFGAITAGTTASATRYLRAYGATTPTTTLTTMTNPITTPTGNANLLDLNTTPATIMFATANTQHLTQHTMTIKNTADSGLITIPAGHIVYYVGVFDGPATTAKPVAWIRMSNPPVNYDYEEQGTLKIPANGYTVNFPA